MGPVAVERVNEEAAPAPVDRLEKLVLAPVEILDDEPAAAPPDEVDEELPAFP